MAMASASVVVVSYSSNRAYFKREVHQTAVGTVK